MYQLCQYLNKRENNPSGVRVARHAVADVEDLSSHFPSCLSLYWDCIYFYILSFVCLFSHRGRLVSKLQLLINKINGKYLHFWSILFLLKFQILLDFFRFSFFFLLYILPGNLILFFYKWILNPRTKTL